MRQIATKERTLALLEHLGKQAKGPGKVYLTGGSSAVLIGWRNTTIDVDLKCDPEPPAIFQAIAEAKDLLNINIELASPDLFIPALPYWQKRSKWIISHGPVEFYHYDFYSQALAKIERGHRRDLDDVKAMVNADLIENSLLMDLFNEIEPDLIRYPGINPDGFREKIKFFIQS